jgi:hypothetical protein
VFSTELLCAGLSDMLDAEPTEVPPDCVEQPEKYRAKTKINIADNVFMEPPQIVDFIHFLLV